MRHVRKLVPKRAPLIALNIAVVLVIAGGTAVYGAMTKTVTLSVDGHTQTIRTFSDHVDDVLKSKDIRLTADDKINKSGSAKLSDGEKIVIKYARPLTLSVDGVSSNHVVYAASSVEDVLQKFHVRADPDAYVSKDRAARLPRAGLDVVVSNPKRLEVIADGHTRKLTTTAPTVSGVLKQAEVRLDGDDEVDPGLYAFVKPNAKLKVTRIKMRTTTQEVKVKFPVEVRKDPSMTKGETKIVNPGKLGTSRQKVFETIADGKVRDRTVLDSTLVAAPVKRIVKQGTQATPSVAASSAPSVASGSVWDKIAQCESGGNWHANTGNGYYGGLQFSLATWQSVGGSGRPDQASREEQIKRATILQKRSGWGQWGCAGARFN